MIQTKQNPFRAGQSSKNLNAEVAVLKQQLAERQPILEATTKQAPAAYGNHLPHAWPPHDLAALAWRRPASSFGR